MKFRSKTVEVEALQWHDPMCGYGKCANDIVAWVNANGGEARYEVADSRLALPVSVRIAVRTINGWAYASPGHYVVMGTAKFTATDPTEFGGGGVHIHEVRDFYPCDPETFAKRWEPISD